MSAGRLLLLALALGLVAVPGWGLAPAERVLEDRMRSAGLELAQSGEMPGALVRGLLPGEGELIVLLFAGCASGAEASLDAALLAVADLARTPRRHTLELVACSAGSVESESARRVAEGWLELHSPAGSRDAVLAALHLELEAHGEAAGAGLLRAGSGPEGRRLPPAWLAHAALHGARAGGGRLRMGAPGWPLLGQLLGRFSRPRVSSGAEPFLAAGVPALTLAGGAPEARWSAVVAGMVRRLDALAGRPRDDDVYLALAGRVWSRRDLYWAGLAVWVVLIVGGRPGAWRGARGGQRQRRGRRYMPGFALRMLFLLLLLLVPAATLFLLAPAALLTLAPLRRRVAVLAGRGLAVVPAVALAGYWTLEWAVGRVGPWPARPLLLALVIGGVVLAVALVGRPPRVEER